MSIDSSLNAEFNYGQWKFIFTEEGYSAYNLGGDGTKRFYSLTMGKYGQPLIVAEPDLAFDAPTNLEYVDMSGNPTTPTEKIAGIICKDGPRLSLSNAASKGIAVHANEDGSITVGNDVWWIVTLFCKDKNRIIGYDAYLRRDRPENVCITELGELDLF